MPNLAGHMKTALIWQALVLFALVEI